MSRMTTETAVDRVSRKLGKDGKEILAKWCGVGVKRVDDWNRPRVPKNGLSGNGRNGSIPDVYHGIILREAQKAKVNITHKDLINV